MFIFKNLQRTRTSNLVISAQKETLEQRQKEILDSINYAKLIQNAFHSNQQLVEDSFPKSFVFDRPKDIVSGDFIWLKKTEFGTWLALGDSTGHGVPGAFMSILNSSALEKAEQELTTCNSGELLNLARKHLLNSLAKNQNIEKRQDGMDCSLLFLSGEKLTYSFANHQGILLRSGEIIELKGDRMPIGSSETNEQLFQSKEISLLKKDKIILFSDGIYDQFGGVQGKKLRLKQLKAKLQSIHSKEINEVSKELEVYFDTWKGENEQIDDVLVFGFEV